MRVFCLDYPLEISISWIDLLSPYNWFCHFYTSHYLMSHSCLACLCSRHNFQCMSFNLDLSIYVPVHAHHLAFTSPLVGEFWLLWIFLSKSWTLELVDSPSCWSEWRSESVDHRQTIWGPILSDPCSSSFPCITHERPFVQFIMVYLFVFLHLCLSVI